MTYKQEHEADPGEFYCAPTSYGKWNIWQRPINRGPHAGYRISIATTSAGPYKDYSSDPANNEKVAVMIVCALNELRGRGYAENPADEMAAESVLRTLEGS